jgi:hypothetical protein
MSKTTQELAVRVMNRLAPGTGTPSASDAKAIKDLYSGTFKELQAQNIAWWEEDAIPEEAFEALSDFIAGRVAIEFGPAKPDLEASGMSRLRILSAAPPTGLAARGVYF